MDSDIDYEKYNIQSENNTPYQVYGVARPGKSINTLSLSIYSSDGIYATYNCGHDSDTNDYGCSYKYTNENILGLENLIDSKITIITKQQFDDFMSQISSLTSTWINNYGDINDKGKKTRWKLERINNGCENKFFGGSNFPDNFIEVVKLFEKLIGLGNNVSIINKIPLRYNSTCPNCGSIDLWESIFSKPNDIYDESKYFVPTQDNIMYKCKQCGYVYSDNYILNDIIDKNIIKINIKNETKNYVLVIRELDNFCKYISFMDLNRMKIKSLYELQEEIDEYKYKKFVERLSLITSNWDLNYSGNGKTNWTIEIKNDNNKKIIYGVGGYPDNWNELIDLLSEYELIYKNNVLSSIKKDTKIEEYLKEIENDVEKELIDKGLIYFKDGKKSYRFGSINIKFSIQKRLLKERYGIDYKPPNEGIELPFGGKIEVNFD